MDISLKSFSNQDIKRKIKLPKRTSKDLIELLGIIFGDGHLDNTKRNRKIVISGDLTEDLEYFKYISLLFKKLFGIEPKLNGQMRDRNELYASINSKAIFTFLKNSEIPVGNKGLIKIPNYLLNSNKLIFSFIRGLFDTDGSITFKKKHKQTHYYPVIKFSSKSPYIINQLNNLFKVNNFKCYACYNLLSKREGKLSYINTIFLSGKDDLKKYISLIGFSNTKHLTKYKIWKRFGFCPPNTNISQRKAILNGNINPINFYKN